MRRKKNSPTGKLYFFECECHYIFAQLKPHFKYKHQLCSFGCQIYTCGQAVYQRISPSLIVLGAVCPTSGRINYSAAKGLSLTKYGVRYADLVDGGIPYH